MKNKESFERNDQNTWMAVYVQMKSGNEREVTFLPQKFDHFSNPLKSSLKFNINDWITFCNDVAIRTQSMFLFFS